MKYNLLIGAVSSGSGKTTFTLGLLRALTRRSMRVQPFKCGPDYIDTQHHKMASGYPSVNIDSFMMSEKHIQELYYRYTSDVDIAISEGVMGLFDGFDGMQGSSAEIASLLNIPVVLVVNAESTAYSVAALIYGFKYFYKEIDVIGVVFNFVSSEKHYEYLKQACKDVGVEAFGYLPKQVDIEIPSRHLGLTLEGNFCFESFANRIADIVERYVDLDRLLTMSVCSTSFKIPVRENRASIDNDLRIAIAKDAAFSFVYEENLQLLRRIGEISYFSPLHDTYLPEVDFVYLPGGYPELYLENLAGNRSMLASVKAYIEKGGKLLAECGGMMYLCNDIVGIDGNSYSMAGVLDQTASMKDMKLTLGYRTLLYNGYKLKGHEFHYSHIVPSMSIIPSVAKAYTAKEKDVATSLYRYKNILAGYTHLYWGDPDRNDWFINYLKGE